MAEWTLSDFQRVCSDLATTTQDAFDFFSGLASDQINRERFRGSRLILAGCYLTAHLLSISLDSAGTGPVQSEGAGGARVQYAIHPFAAGDLSLSRYGIAFARLARLAGAGGFVA